MARQRHRTAFDGGEANRELIRETRRILSGVQFFCPLANRTKCHADKLTKQTNQVREQKKPLQDAEGK